MKFLKIWIFCGFSLSLALFSLFLLAVFLEYLMTLNIPGELLAVAFIWFIALLPAAFIYTELQ